MAVRGQRKGGCRLGICGGWLRQPWQPIHPLRLLLCRLDDGTQIIVPGLGSIGWVQDGREVPSARMAIVGAWAD